MSVEWNKNLGILVVKLMFTVSKMNILYINWIRSEHVHRKVTRKLFEFVSSFRSKTLETSIYSGAEQCTAVHNKGQTISERIYEVIVSPKNSDLVRAEILTIFCSYFGRNDDFIDSFWNQLSFILGLKARGQAKYGSGRASSCQKQWRITSIILQGYQFWCIMIHEHVFIVSA